MKRITIIFTILAMIASGCNQATKQHNVDEQNTDTRTVETTSDEHVFTWSNDLCSYEGFYNPQQITEQQLQNAHRLVMDNDWEFRLNTNSVYKPDDVKKLNRQELKDDYAEKKKRILNLRLPEYEIWETFRIERLQEIKQEYETKDILYEAFLTKNFDVLKKHPNFNSDQCLNFYTMALIKGGDDLLAAWRHYIDEEVNVGNATIRNDYNEKLHSTLKYEYARVDILTFGWWNCANKHINRFDPEEKAMKEFMNLFIKTNEECEEP